MSEAIRQIAFWIVIIGTLILITLVWYSVLQWIAKRDAQKEFQIKQKQFDQQYIEFSEKEKRFCEDADAVYERLKKQKAEAISKEQQATETLRKAQQFREESQVKIDQLIQENTKLRADLTAARQRAKRLANKLTNAG